MLSILKLSLFLHAAIAPVVPTTFVATPEQSYTAIMHIYPHVLRRQCLIARRDHIVSNIAASQQVHNVPPAVITAIGFAETHLGCDHGEGGGWGAPISPTRRHIAGTPLHAARALATSYRVCGNWNGAVRRFRTGLCHSTRVGDQYMNNVIHLINRIERNAIAGNTPTVSTEPTASMAIGDQIPRF